MLLHFHFYVTAFLLNGMHSFDLKPGVLLPKNDDQWKLAKLYFQSTFSSLTFNPDTMG